VEVRYGSTPFLGNSAFEVQMGNARPSSPAALFLGAGRAGLRLTASCTLLVDPALALVTLPARTSTLGRVGFRFAIPNDNSLMGQTLPTQWFVADPQGQSFAGLGIVLSDGNEWRFGIM
jgi:hypothetical protein